MYDLLPFPNLVTRTSEEQIKELVRYLVQFKETLEFLITNIGIDNLSPELREKLSAVGVSQNEDEVVQITSKILSVADIVESPLFEEAVRNIISNS
jgi:hypothetical protein